MLALFRASWIGNRASRIGNALSWYTSHAWTACRMVLERVVCQTFRVYSEMRSKYRWEYRLRVPDFIKPVGDSLFTLGENASVDLPTNVSESIKILRAHLTTTWNNVPIDVSKTVQSAFDTKRFCYGSSKVAFYITDFHESIPCPNTDDDSDEWYLDIMYMGHSNPSKKIPAAEFGVRYNAKVSSALLFPPYEATEQIKKGLRANKVIHARTFHEKDLTELARKYAGLRANFYEDVNDSQVQKFYIDHSETHVLLNNQKTIVVSNKSKKIS